MSSWIKYVAKRTHGVRPELFDRAWQSATIEFLGSDEPMCRESRRLLAGELKRLYWPETPRQISAKIRSARVMAYEMLWEDQVEQLRSKGHKSSRMEADEIVAQAFGLESGENFRKFMTRNRPNKRFPKRK